MLPDVVRPLTSSPGESGIFLDFDGTLSEIVPVPSDARPLPGVVDTLAQLSEVFAVVSVVSGRATHELAAWLGPDVEVWGTHGAERAHRGRTSLDPRLEPWRDRIAAARREIEDRVAAAEVDGIVVEDKVVAVTVHWRNADDRDRAAETARAAVADLAARDGLATASGKMALELRPPVEMSKADVVFRRAREERLSGAMFAGDDLVDLPAFDALDRLAREGAETVRVAVDSEETPEEILRRADVVVDGPSGAVAFLGELAAAARR
ncbi:MAG TPA: trehalose-phosphatase [Actinomycetota bacterium]|nr:trehalose-phosphatase [Actinomycetota bacterium]